MIAVTQTDTVNVLLQCAVEARDALPSDSKFDVWAQACIVKSDWREVGVRIVTIDESASLNQQYRGKKGATNVLSFPFEAPPEVEDDYLGDLVICADVVQREANEQNKLPEHHWAHMLVHGLLHLQGYDHETDTEAQEMESLEIEILQQLGYSNPYI